LPPLESLNMFIKVCDVVSYAHSKGIVHRDLKPDNIILNDEGNPIILDFGICHFLDEDNRLTATMEQVGSRYYIAPELEDGRSSKITKAVDAYALGKILYYLITKKPFARENFSGDNDLSVLKKNPQLNYITDRIFAKSITNDPANRLSVKYLKEEASKIYKLLNEHFYPNRIGIGSQCRFCGEGKYKSLSFNGLNVWTYYQDHPNQSTPKDSRIKCEAIECDTCGNIQWFKIPDNDSGYEFPDPKM